MKIAVPISNGSLSSHFGHCEQFAVMETEGKEITNTRYLDPPPHEPGSLPRFLRSEGAELVIAGGMGRRAQNLFTEQGIAVVCGAPEATPESVVKAYLRGELEVGDNACDH
jgi:predicted Fe-Mo cluster-binding NifX family protein